MIQELDMARNWWGKLKPDIKERIINYIENPTTDNWDDVHGIILSVGKETGLGLTLWQAILVVCPTFPCRGRSTTLKNEIIDDWERIPTIQQIETALRYATH